MFWSEQEDITADGGFIVFLDIVYRRTGIRKYLDFAREWDYTYLWDKLNAHDSAIGPRHAYSQVNSFSSAAMAYLATGDKKYLDAAENGYALVTEKHTYATGGYGPAEV